MMLDRRHKAGLYCAPQIQAFARDFPIPAPLMPGRSAGGGLSSSLAPPALQLPLTTH